MVLVTGMVLGFTFSKKTVFITKQDGHQMELSTNSKNIEELLVECDIVLGPEHVVIPDITTPIEEGMLVEIRKQHNISLIADSKKQEFVSTARTVKEVLQEQQIRLDDDDIVKPELEQKITKDSEIRVIRVETRTEEKTVQIPYSTESVKKYDLPGGITKTVTRGINGEELQKWTVVYHDGKEASRQLLEKRTVLEPKNAVVHVGMGQRTVSRGGETFRYRRALDVKASAYTYTGNNTASGVPPSYGVVAVDPRVIPLGTRLYIEGYGYATALDTGGAIRGNRIDVFLETLSAARSWGIKNVRMYVLE